MVKINSRQLYWILWLISYTANAQTTLKINLKQADSIFVASNFYLLASSMNIEAQKAQIIQAKVYPNPVFTADVNTYDPANKEFFHAGKTGQKEFRLEQLVLLGGKRKSEIEMAKTNVGIAELEFQRLMQQLKFRLHSDLYAAGQQQLLLSRYNSQLALLDTLLAAYQVQIDKGNVPLKDFVRLKGAYLKLNNDRAELLKDYYETQTSLQTLLQTDSTIEFQFSEKEIERYIKWNTLEQLKADALLYRPDLLIMQQNKVLAEQYLQYQKRLAIPDINLSASYDQRGGAFNNQINAGFSVTLPSWNRNKGNIKTSQFKLKEADYGLQAMQSEVIHSLQNSYTFYSQTVFEYQKITALYNNEEFETTSDGITKNFRKQNISIVEFMDFFEAYNGALTELSRIKTQLVRSGEQLNLLIGKDIY